MSLGDKNYNEIVLNALKVPHTVLTNKSIEILTRSSYGTTIISRLRAQGHPIIHSTRKNSKSGKEYYCYMLARRF